MTGCEAAAVVAQSFNGTNFAYSATVKFLRCSGNPGVRLLTFTARTAEGQEGPRSALVTTVRANPCSSPAQVLAVAPAQLERRLLRTRNLTVTVCGLGPALAAGDARVVGFEVDGRVYGAGAGGSAEGRWSVVNASAGAAGADAQVAVLAAEGYNFSRFAAESYPRVAYSLGNSSEVLWTPNTVQSVAFVPDQAEVPVPAAVVATVPEQVKVPFPKDFWAIVPPADPTWDWQAGLQAQPGAVAWTPVTSIGQYSPPAVVTFTFVSPVLAGFGDVPRPVRVLLVRTPRDANSTLEAQVWGTAQLIVRPGPPAPPADPCAPFAASGNLTLAFSAARSSPRGVLRADNQTRVVAFDGCNLGAVTAAGLLGAIYGVSNGTGAGAPTVRGSCVLRAPQSGANSTSTLWGLDCAVGFERLDALFYSALQDKRVFLTAAGVPSALAPFEVPELFVAPLPDLALPAGAAPVVLAAGQPLTNFTVLLPSRATVAYSFQPDMALLFTPKPAAGAGGNASLPLPPEASVVVRVPADSPRRRVLPDNRTLALTVDSALFPDPRRFGVSSGALNYSVSFIFTCGGPGGNEERCVAPDAPDSYGQSVPPAAAVIALDPPVVSVLPAPPGPCEGVRAPVLQSLSPALVGLDVANGGLEGDHLYTGAYVDFAGCNLQSVRGPSGAPAPAPPVFALPNCQFVDIVAFAQDPLTNVSRGTLAISQCDPSVLGPAVLNGTVLVPANPFAPAPNASYIPVTVVQTLTFARCSPTPRFVRSSPASVVRGDLGQGYGVTSISLSLCAPLDRDIVPQALVFAKTQVFNASQFSLDANRTQLTFAPLPFDYRASPLLEGGLALMTYTRRSENNTRVHTAPPLSDAAVDFTPDEMFSISPSSVLWNEATPIRAELNLPYYPPADGPEGPPQWAVWVDSVQTPEVQLVRNATLDPATGLLTFVLQPFAQEFHSWARLTLVNLATNDNWAVAEDAIYIHTSDRCEGVADPQMWVPTAQRSVPIWPPLVPGRAYLLPLLGCNIGNLSSVAMYNRSYSDFTLSPVGNSTTTFLVMLSANLSLDALNYASFTRDLRFTYPAPAPATNSSTNATTEVTVLVRRALPALARLPAPTFAPAYTPHFEAVLNFSLAANLSAASGTGAEPSAATLARLRVRLMSADTTLFFSLQNQRVQPPSAATEGLTVFSGQLGPFPDPGKLPAQYAVLLEYTCRPANHSRANSSSTTPECKDYEAVVAQPLAPFAVEGSGKLPEPVVKGVRACGCGAAKRVAGTRARRIRAQLITAQEAARACFFFFF